MSRKMTAALAGLMLTTALGACTRIEEGPACDRACLIDLTNKYVAGLEGKSIEGIPFSDEVIIVENLKRIKAGQGLWTDVTGKGTDFSVVVPDEARQTAGWIGMVERDGKPTVVAVRLQLDPKGSIVEAEHLYSEVSETSPFGGPSPLANLQTPRPGLLAEVPQADRKTGDELIKLGESYYPALDDNDGTLMPFAEDCERHENGMVTAGGNSGPGPNGPQPHPVARDCAGQLTSGTFQYIATIDNRRVFAADPVTGLVMGLSHFHHPMDFTSYDVTAMDGTKVPTARNAGFFKDMQPFDLPAAHIFKVGADGKVHEIEAMGFRADLNSPTGWEDDAPAP